MYTAQSKFKNQKGFTHLFLIVLLAVLGLLTLFFAKPEIFRSFSGVLAVQTGVVQLPVYEDLSVNETARFTTSDGNSHTITLKSQSLDQVVFIVDGVTLSFPLSNGSTSKLVGWPNPPIQTSPRIVNGVRVLPEAVKAITQRDPEGRFKRLNLTKDARVFLFDETRLMPQGVIPYRLSSSPSTTLRQGFLENATYGLHMGVDFALPEGTPMQSVVNNAVVRTIDSNPAGLEGIYVGLQDSNYTYRYMHLSRIASGLAVGQTLQKGQIIGYSGKTGTSYPHLHFSMQAKKIDGLAIVADINPWPFIVAWNSPSSPAPTTTPSPSPTPLPDTIKPEVMILDPDEVVNTTSSLTAFAPITLQATATDNVKVTKVEFLVNGQIICSDTTSPYSCSWTMPEGPGIVYTITAKAYDAANNTSTDSITITAPSPDITNPTVQLTSPVDGDTPYRFTRITLAAVATDNIEVSKVEFLVDGDLKCTTTTEHMCEWWIPGEIGENFTITAKAYDTSGNTSSDSVTITTLEKPTGIPSVTLITPEDGQTHRRWTYLNMSAVASDDQAITKVEFLVNGEIKCTDTSEDYTCSWWMGGNVGDVYTITAKAYDASGNVKSDSAQVTAVAYFRL